MLATIKIAEGESRLTVNVPEQSLQLNVISYEEVPLFTKHQSSPTVTSPFQGEIESYVRQVFGKNAPRALQIIQCESNFRPTVISPTNDVGVFQINIAAHGIQIAPTRTEQIKWLSDIKNNVNFAYQLFLKSGWSPWVCNRII